MQEDPLVAQCQARIGKMINGKYRLDALIGIGGMAAVYMATHRNGSIAAVKILHDEVALNQEVRERFLREAYIANKVGHDGTVKVLDDDVDEHNTPFLVMELLQGQSVEEYAESNGGRLSIEQTLDIVDATLAVLEAAHRHKIIHRDLKPENLFLTQQRVVKVLDFGIARLREDSARKTQTGMVMGTPSFMAPEQAMGRWNEVDGRTDIYAVGATAFTLLSGLPVHEADTAGEMLVAAATRPARSLARVLSNAPFNLVALVDKALAYERDKRHPDATTFRRELAKVRASLDGEELAATEAEPDRPMIAPTMSGNDTASGMAANDMVDYDERDHGIDSYDPSENTEEEINAMAEVFALLERALVATKQYSDDHPETKRRFDEAFRNLASALMTCDICLAWNLTPYGFVVGERVIWEPEVPWNRIPYQLFSDGVRTIGFVPGLDEDEFRRWIELVTLDPSEDFSPEDDMVTQIWDAAFMNIFHQAIDSFAEGNQEQRARYEADRMAIIHGAQKSQTSEVASAWKSGQAQGGTDAAQRSRQVMNFVARGEQIDAETAARVNNMNIVEADGDELTEEAEALMLDESTRALLAARLQPDVGGTSERFVYAAAQAFVASARMGRSQAVAVPLRRAVEGLGRGEPRRAMDMILELRDAIEVEGKELETQNLRDMLTTEVLSPKTLGEILDGSMSIPAGEAEAYQEALHGILNCIQGQHFDSIVEFLPKVQDEALLKTLLDFMARTGRGNEQKLAALFKDADVELGLSLVRILAAIGSDEAKEAITEATSSPHPLVRIEAMGHLEGVSSIRARQEMKKLLDDQDENVRLAALKAMEDHMIHAAGPFLVIRIQEKAFAKLPLAERRQSLQTLRVLKAQRCEEVCVALVQESSWLRSEAADSTRILACEFLAEVTTSNNGFYALESIAKAKGWKDSKRVKAAAQAAIARITERAEEIQARRKERTMMKKRKKQGGKTTRRTRAAAEARASGTSTAETGARPTRGHAARATASEAGSSEP